MKVFVKFLLVFVVVAVIAGCASDVVYIPKIPTHVQSALMDYNQQPGQKAFVLAVDAGGNYAFGSEYGKDTIEEALEIATKKCDIGRETHRIAGKAYIYALNDRVVYEEMIRSDNQGKSKDAEPAPEAE